jgi:hypothetical protein
MVVTTTAAALATASPAAGTEVLPRIREAAPVTSALRPEPENVRQVFSGRLEASGLVPVPVPLPE